MAKAEQISLSKKGIDEVEHPDEKYVVYGFENTPYLFLRVTPTKKTFVYQRTVSGKQVRITLGAYPSMTLKDVRKAAESISGDYAKGTDVKAARLAKTDELTFGEVAEAYLYRKPRNVEPKSLISQYETYLQHWAARPLSNISTDMVRKHINKIRVGKHRHVGASYGGPGMARKIYTQTKAIFNYAISDFDWPGRNPVTFKKDAEPKAKKTRLYADEMQKALDAIDGQKNRPTRELFYMLLWTGRSKGVCLRAEWVNIDLETGRWNVNPRHKADGEAAVVLQIPDKLVSRLIEYQEWLRDKYGSAGRWVFPGRGDRSKHLADPKRAWDAVREALGRPDLQLKNLRNTYVSMAIESGVNPAVTAELTGHSEETMMKHYAKASDEAKATAANDIVGSMFGGR